MYYLMWRVLCGLHDEITLSFLIVGHTKFAPDWCFGLAKQCFWRTLVSSLDDIANTVAQSSIVNVPQLVGTLEGDVFVPTYNWSEFFENHVVKTALREISKLQHFRFSRSTPGVVYVKSSSAGSEKKITLIKEQSWKPSPSDLPEIVVPNGLTPEQQLYLYEKIREFCTDSTKDLVCPRPSCVAE